jgi:hypothetical protein
MLQILPTVESVSTKLRDGTQLIRLRDKGG